MGTDRAPSIIAVGLFILLSPGLLFQLPSRTRFCEFENMYTSGISDGPSGDSSFDVENPELDSKLDFLRNKLSKVGKESAELNRELRALERQSMLSGRSAASLTEALELYQQQSVNEKFEELVRTASDFRAKVEILPTRTMEDSEHPRAKKSRISNGELYRLNNDEGLLSATVEELQELVNDIKTLRD